MSGDFDDLLEQQTNKAQNKSEPVGDFDQLLENRAKTTYQYSSNEEYEDLKRAVGDVGYSGLDENQKKLFDAQLVNSKAARAGMTAEQIHDYVDQAAGINEANKNAGSAWTLGRSLLSLPVAALGGLIGGFDKYEQDPNTGLAVERMPGSSYIDRVSEDQNQIIKESINNEGAAGFLTNPINVMGGAFNAIKGIPYAGSAIGRGVIEGATSSAIDQYNSGDNTVGIQPMVTRTLMGGGVGGALGATAGFLKQYGKESFPGIMTGNARSIDASTKARLAENLDEIMSAGFMPKNRRGFEQLSDRVTAELGEVFNKGIKESTPYSFYDESNRVMDIVDAEGGFMLPSAMHRNPSTIYHASGVRNDYMLPPESRVLNEFGELEHVGPDGQTLIPATNIPMITPLSEIETAVKEQYTRKLANADMLSDKNLKILDKQIQSTKKSKAFRDNTEETVNALYTPGSREKELDVYTNNPVYEAQELSNLRNNRNDPNMYKDPTKSGEIQHANRLLATTWRDVINDRLSLDPRYARNVTPEVRSRYGLYKSLGDVVDAPGSVRLSDRIFGLSVDPWLRASTFYKAGGLIDKARLAVPGIVTEIKNNN